MRLDRPVPAIVYLVAYLCYLGLFTLAPYGFTMDSGAEKAWVGWSRSGSDVLLNVLGFFPLGVILYYVLAPRSQSLQIRWGITTGAAAVLSFAIEAGQMYLPTRVPSAADVLANTLGAAVGFLMAHRLHQGGLRDSLKAHRRALAVGCLTLYSGSVIGLFVWVGAPQGLKGWDPDFPLLVGNEATFNRPWLGKIFFLALYDRVLSQKEIETLFDLGPHYEARGDMVGEPVALYTFQEGTGTRVHDRAVDGVRLDLEITEPENARWLGAGGLELIGANALRSPGGAKKIYERVTATDTLSLVVWIEPANARQTGPARIVSFSLTPSLRNFTLGQENGEIHFRVRNQVAGPNGTRLDLRTRNLGLSPKRTNLVATYDVGVVRLYVDGVCCPVAVVQDGLTFMARVLHADANLQWQRALVGILLLAPVAYLVGAVITK